jgi:toxin ParE1/3/4
MRYTLTLRREAESDLNEQFEYYEKIREGLGYDFLLCVESAIERIRRNPRIYKAAYKDLRCIPIQRFPHRIYFLVQQ